MLLLAEGDPYAAGQALGEVIGKLALTATIVYFIVYPIRQSRIRRQYGKTGGHRPVSYQPPAGSAYSTWGTQLPPVPTAALVQHPVQQPPPPPY